MWHTRIRKHTRQDIAVYTLCIRVCPISFCWLLGNFVLASALNSLGHGMQQGIRAKQQ